MLKSYYRWAYFRKRNRNDLVVEAKPAGSLSDQGDRFGRLLCGRNLPSLKASSPSTNVFTWCLQPHMVYISTSMHVTQILATQIFLVLVSHWAHVSTRVSESSLRLSEKQGCSVSNKSFKFLGTPLLMRVTMLHIMLCSNSPSSESPCFSVFCCSS